MQRLLLLTLAVVSLASALEDPTEKLNAIQHEAEAKTAACAREWLGRARLTPVRIPAVNPADAKPSEAKALDEARLTNDALKSLRDLLADPKLDTDKNLTAALTPGLIRRIIAAQGMPADAPKKAAPAESAGHR